MRLTRWMQGLMVLSAAACSDGVTAPPTGLPVTFAPIASVDRLPTPSITGAGDSVSAIIVRVGGICGSIPTAVAGLRATTLVMTITTSIESVPCPLLAREQVYSLTVVDVPAGMRTAQVVWRSVGAHSVSDSVYVSGRIDLP